MPLVDHLRREVRMFRRGLPDELGLPNVVGERLLAVDVLAVDQRQIRGKGVRMLGGGDYDRVEVVRVIEDATKIVEPLGLWVALGRRVKRNLVNVAEHDDVLV